MQGIKEISRKELTIELLPRREFRMEFLDAGYFLSQKTPKLRPSPVMKFLQEINTVFTLDLASLPS